MADLESRLGELAGNLNALRPVLETIDRRLDETRDLAVRLEAEIKALRAEVRSALDKNSEHHKDFYRRIQAIESLKGDVDRLLEARKEDKAKWWDVLKVILQWTIPAILGALAALAAGGKL